MPRPPAYPGTALGCAIIHRAVKDWKLNQAGRALPYHSWSATPRCMQAERDSLLRFFNSSWFDFLFESSTEEIDRDEMFEALGIPVLQRGGG